MKCVYVTFSPHLYILVGHTLLRRGQLQSLFLISHFLILQAGRWVLDIVALCICYNFLDHTRYIMCLLFRYGGGGREGHEKRENV